MERHYEMLWEAMDNEGKIWMCFPLYSTCANHLCKQAYYVNHWWMEITSEWALSKPLIYLNENFHILNCNLSYLNLILIWIHWLCACQSLYCEPCCAVSGHCTVWIRQWCMIPSYRENLSSPCDLKTMIMSKLLSLLLQPVCSIKLATSLCMLRIT